MKKWILILFILLITSGCSQKQSAEQDNLKQSAFEAELSNEFEDQGSHVKVQMNHESYSLPLKDMNLEITNIGTEAAGYGNIMYFEKLVDGVWYDMPFTRLGFTDEGLSLEPGDEITDEIPVTYLDYDFTPGTYRIVKEFWADENRHAIAAEFEIR